MKQATPRSLPARSNLQPAVACAIADSRAAMNSIFGDAGLVAVFDTSAEALLVVNAKGIIQRANPRAAELLRSKESGLLQKELGEIFLAAGVGGVFQALRLAGGVESTLTP